VFIRGASALAYSLCAEISGSEERRATWSGRGKPPSWIAKARDRDRFLIPQ